MKMNKLVVPILVFILLVSSVYAPNGDGSGSDYDYGSDDSYSDPDFYSNSDQSCSIFSPNKINFIIRF